MQKDTQKKMQKEMQKEAKDFLRVEEKVKIAWRITRGIGTLVMLLFLGGCAIAIKEFDLISKVNFMDGDLLEFILKLVAGLIIAENIFGLIFYPWIEYHQWGYRITDDKVEIRKGIIFLETSMIPIVRIQHVSTSQGPIFRALGLYKIEISVATSNFEIVGIKKDTAEAIVESLKEKLYTRLEGEGIVWKKAESSDQPGEV